jgi:protein O-mannosyl-transferase
MKKKTVRKQTSAYVKPTKTAAVTLPRKGGVKEIGNKSHAKEVAIILVITFLAYIPALKAGFVNWDDTDYANELYLKGAFSNLGTLLTGSVQGNYHPLTMISLALNYSISGMDAWSYHLVNLLLHMTSCILVFRFIMLLTDRNVIIAFITSLLFGVHPMHVESVAWVSERKDVLYGVFFIAALIAYTKYIDARDRKQYWTSVMFLILALLSKPAAVIFPLVLFCIDFFRRRELNSRLLIEKIPFFVLAFVMGLITFLAQKEKGAIDTEVLTMSTRFFMGFYGIMMYIIKMILPVGLSPLYPFPPLNKSLPVEYYLAPAFAIVLVGVVVYSLRKTRVVAFGVLFYITNLLLVLQFLPVGSAVIADRYSYLPYVGLFFIIGWLISRYSKDNLKRSYYVSLPLGILLLVLTSRQATVWTSGASLWDHAIEINPNSKAYDLRARLYTEEKNYDMALSYYNEALKLNAIDHEAFVDRGNVYFNTNKLDLAYQDYKKALSIKQNYPPALDNLGALFAMGGRYDSALACFNKALVIQPDYVPPYRNRALALMDLRRYDEAIRDFETFLKFNPDNPDIFNALGACYRLGGKNLDAIANINKALAMKEDPHFYLNRSYCYNNLNKKEDARRDALAAKNGGLVLEVAYANELGIQ